MKRHPTEVIVLKRIDYGEADRILTLLSPQLGIISGIAKGVRKLKSKLAYAVEPLAINKVILLEGKSDLYTITSASVVKSFSNITKDLKRTEAAFSLIKKLLKIKFSHDNSRLYKILVVALESFDKQIDIDLVGLWSYLHILDELGQLPNLTHDENDQPLNKDLSYGLDYENGRLVPGGQLNADDIKLWRLASRYTPEKLAKVKGAKEAASRSVEVAERALEYQITR